MGEAHEFNSLDLSQFRFRQLTFPLAKGYPQELATPYQGAEDDWRITYSITLHLAPIGFN